MKGLLGWLEDLLRVLVGNRQPQPVPVPVAAPVKPRRTR
jgi:hypothetical protein